MTRVDLALCYRKQLRLILPFRARPGARGKETGLLVNLAGEKDRRQGSDLASPGSPTREDERGTKKTAKKNRRGKRAKKRQGKLVSKQVAGTR